MTEKQVNYKTSKRRISIRSGILLSINLVFIVLLLASYVSVYLPPTTFWMVAFLGFAYPVLLLSNVFFCLLWIVFLKKRFILSLIAILIGFNHLNATFRFSTQEEKLRRAESIRVLSYNVRLFDIYNWNSKNDRASDYTEIMKTFRSIDADIVCLQEYYKGSASSFLYSDSIKSIRGLKYEVIELIKKGNKNLPFGLATFSRYPIVNQFKHEFDNTYVNFCLVTDIAVRKDTIRVMNTHLESIKFGKEDYIFVDGIAKRTTGKKDLSESSRIILVKMARAYKKRGSQVRELEQLIIKSPYPVLLCGDFNDTPVSYAYDRISRHLDDAFVRKGNGFGKTYGNYLPFLRIDYIFSDKTLKCNNFTILKNSYSDHYPLYADFEFTKSAH